MQRTPDNVFYELFVIAILIAWSPVKPLAYVAAFLVLGWLLYRTNSGRILQRFLLVSSLFALVVVFYYMLHVFVGSTFLLPNAFVSLLMYSPFFFLLVAPAPLNVNQEYGYEKYARVLTVVAWIQGVMGSFQYVGARFGDISSGDAVQGTVSPLSFLASSAGFGNQIFAISIIFTLLFLLPYVFVHRKGRLAFAVALFSLMLALVVHAFIALLISVFVTVFLFREHLLFSQFKVFAVATGSVVALVLILAVFMSTFVENSLMYLELYERGDDPRTEAVAIAQNELPAEYPMIYFTGLGPGQYSSRAGLISSGYYFSGFEGPQAGSFFLQSMSVPFREHVFPAWQAYAINNDRYGNSTMSRPFFSALSVYTEFGLVFMLGLLALVGYCVYQLRKVYIRAYREQQMLPRWLAMATGIAIIFLATVSFFENYLETAQAIFPGLLLIRKFYSTLLAPAQVSILPTKVQAKA